MNRSIIVAGVQIEGFLCEGFPASFRFGSKVALRTSRCAALWLKSMDSQVLVEISAETAGPVAKEALIVLRIDVDAKTNRTTTLDDVIEGSLRQ